MNKKTILILNNHLKLFYGSELHCLHIAEYFRNKNYDVVLAALDIGEPFISAAKEKGIRTLNLETRGSVFRESYDIVWSHHLTTFFLAHIVNRVVARHFIHGCLSAYLEIEKAPISNRFVFSNRLNILANSVETQNIVCKQVNPRQPISLFRNLVPKKFYYLKKETYNSRIRNVIIVSNHVPPELRAAIQLFENRKIHVKVMGIEDDHSLVDHNTLIKFDVVITIGKTVQFALVQGIPVFLYDHFGGPGYLDRQNIFRHEDFNYSGRSEPTKLTSCQIVTAVVAGYANAVEFAQYASSKFGHRYSVEHQMENLEAQFREAPQNQRPLFSIAERIHLFKFFYSSHRKFLIYSVRFWLRSLCFGRAGRLFRVVRTVYRLRLYPISVFRFLRKSGCKTWLGKIIF